MTNKHLALWIVVLVSVHLAGCSLAPPGETPHLPTHTPSPNMRPSSSPESPASVPASRVPPTRIPGPTCTPTPIPVPTRTADEERAYVREMLTTNGGCELPCWWGITPGETTWRTVQDQFGLYYGQGQARPDGTVHHEGPTYGLSPGRFFDYYVKCTFVEKHGIVQSIQVVGSLRGDTSEHLAQDWSRYSLDQILARYGVPSQVAVSPATMEKDYYRLYVFYDDLGIGIRYLGPVFRAGESARICFSFEHITLWLQSPDSSTPLHQSVAPDEWSMVTSIEQAAGMSVEGFREAFRQPGSCLEVPLASW